MTFDWKMDLPIPEAARASLPPDFPTAIVMNGNTCLTTDQFKKYVELGGKEPDRQHHVHAGSQGGAARRDRPAADRPGTASIELQSVVTSIGEQDVPASAFEIPAGYKEVPSPAGVPGIK